MHLTREDMLRELELLPVWRARIPSAMPLQTEALAPEPTLATEAAVPPVGEFEQSSAVTPVVEEAPLDIPPAVAEPSFTAFADEPLVKTPWLLYCPQAGDVQSLQLLQNILRALKLPHEEVSLIQQPLRLEQVQVRYGVLFGLDEANRFLGTNHADIAAVRGQILAFADSWLVITHSPQAMLQNPSLKKDVWQDLCLLLAKRGEEAA